MLINFPFYSFQLLPNCLSLVHCMAAKLFISKANHNQRTYILHSISWLLSAVSCKVQRQLQLILSHNY